MVGCLIPAVVAGGAHAQQVQAFTYDVHGRLTSLSRTIGGSTQTTTYGLDAADNRTSRLLGAPSVASGLVSAGTSGTDTLVPEGAAREREVESLREAADVSQDASAEESPDQPAN